MEGNNIFYMEVVETPKQPIYLQKDGKWTMAKVDKVREEIPKGEIYISYPNRVIRSPGRSPKSIGRETTLLRTSYHVVPGHGTHHNPACPTNYTPR
jgi:hypothetical protein